MAIYHIFKIIVLDKVFIGGTYAFKQMKGKFLKSNYYNNIKIYNKLYQYIEEFDISKNDINFELIYKKYFIKRCISEHRFILDEFIQIYDSIETGLNMSKLELEPEKNSIIIVKTKLNNPISKCERAKRYYQKYRTRILLKNKEKKYCSICDSFIVHSQLTRHRTTQKHKLNLTINDLKSNQVSIV